MTNDLAAFLKARLDEDSRWFGAEMRREIVAKRRILAEFNARDTDTELMLGPDTLRQREWSGLRVAVRLLAAVYSDHPDYRQEWHQDPERRREMLSEQERSHW